MIATIVGAVYFEFLFWRSKKYNLEFKMTSEYSSFLSNSLAS